MQGPYAGRVEKGDTLRFAWAPRIDDGTVSTFNPDRWDLIKASTGAFVVTDGSTSRFPVASSIYGERIRLVSIDTEALSMDVDEYVLVLKEGTGTSPTEFVTFIVQVAAPLAGKLDWIANDVENVVFPRLKRLLEMSGENTLLDDFEYDAAGNCTSLRVRHFEDRASAADATPDIADGSLPEPGETETYRITQTYESPRNVRVTHLSVPDADAADASATPNTLSSPGLAPGNSGSYPS